VPSRSKPSNLRATKQDEATFSEVVRLIAASRERAFQAVNTELIDLYWQVGATISRKIKAAEWGDGVVERLAAYIAKTQPGLRGFTRATLFRMRQIYETYQADETVVPLVRQLPWSHHLIILGRAEHENYFGLSIPERRLSELENSPNARQAYRNNPFVMSHNCLRQWELSSAIPRYRQFCSNCCKIGRCYLIGGGGDAGCGVQAPAMTVWAYQKGREALLSRTEGRRG
jgi:DUF1016 N-terminal domain